MTITIITVVLNDLENLKFTFSSLNEQTCKDFEWIIKDGESNDNFISYYEQNIRSSELNVKLFVEKDTSIYDAMNQAVKYSSNQFVLFLNAGDYLAEKETIQKIYQSIENINTEVSFIYGDAIDKTKNGKFLYKKARELNYLKHSLPTAHQAILYNRTLFDKYKYSQEYLIASDYALTAQIFYDGNRTYFRLKFPICIFSLGGISSRRRDILLKEGYRIHRNIIKDNAIIALLKLIKRVITFKILDEYPRLYSILRTFAQ